MSDVHAASHNLSCLQTLLTVSVTDVEDYTERREEGGANPPFQGNIKQLIIYMNSAESV